MQPNDETTEAGLAPTDAEQSATEPIVTRSDAPPEGTPNSSLAAAPDPDAPSGDPAAPATPVIAPLATPSAPTPTHVAVGQLGADEGSQQFVADAKSAVGTAADAIIAGIGQALAGLGSEIVPLEGALVPAATALIEAKTSPQVGGVIKSLLGIATPIVSPLEQMVNAKIVAGLAILQADLANLKL